MYKINVLFSDKLLDCHINLTLEIVYIIVSPPLRWLYMQNCIVHFCGVGKWDLMPFFLYDLLTLEHEALSAISCISFSKNGKSFLIHVKGLLMDSKNSLFIFFFYKNFYCHSCIICFPLCEASF